ncbi:hypothetical protein UFOVP75_131 [uncultured Caudovirales phage]|uniref:Uncharacterized protein n=1 Tax=uncultured Caudovirales phage TaxID=2100421 RepID=A0A6J5L225_9CAUD|nr:hypothetical protein UFOVP75_131 [uncultured Caudovirales phage]
MSQTAAHLKAFALAWLRYGKKMPVVCTEVGNWSADVLGVSQYQSIEVEVKTSISDLKADFKNKTAKHYLYSQAEGMTPASIPNYFYFMVPHEISDKAVAEISLHSTKIGVISVEPEMRLESFHPRLVSIPKKGLALHKEKPSMRMLEMALLRNSSELCGLYRHNVLLREQFKNLVDKYEKAVEHMAAFTVGALDFESPEQSRHDIAVMLARIVGVVSNDDEFSGLALGERKNWLAAADRYIAEQVRSAEGVFRG